MKCHADATKILTRRLVSVLVHTIAPKANLVYLEEPGN